MLLIGIGFVLGVLAMGAVRQVSSAMDRRRDTARAEAQPCPACGRS